MIEWNAVPAQQARVRIAELGLTNARMHEGSIYDEEVAALKFDVGIGLHACGAMTDVIHTYCLRQHAAYVLASCCVGKIAQTINENTAPHRSNKDARLQLTYPRSKAIAAVVTSDQFAFLASGGDWATEVLSVQADKHRMCKRYIELDRTMAAREAGYQTTLMCQMVPWTCTPKHDLIAGLHPDQAQNLPI